MPQPSPDSPVREGDVIAGKYRVERVLGAGGMGVVVAAKHLELGELFALKFLLPSARNNREVAARFAREARTGIRIKNEHVARVFDVGTLPDGAPYMVMEHLTGEDLSAMISRRGPLPVAETIDLLLQACEAICEAHQMGVVHRDLKPANLFVTTASDGLPFVKVLDFGISKLVTGGEDVSVTATAAVLGSPLYMSPEQLTSSRDVDLRSDMWSLGVILYEMLTAKTPFVGGSFPALCASILVGKFAPPSTLRPDLPPALEAVVVSLLALERDARLPSVTALSAAVAPFGTSHAEASNQRIGRIAVRMPAPSAHSLDPGMPIELAATEEASSQDKEVSEPSRHVRDTGQGLSRSGTSAGGVSASRRVLRISVGVVSVAALGLFFWLGQRGSPPVPATTSGPLSALSAQGGAIEPAPAIANSRPSEPASAHDSAPPGVSQATSPDPSKAKPATPAPTGPSRPRAPPRAASSGARPGAPATDPMFDSQR